MSRAPKAATATAPWMSFLLIVLMKYLPMPFQAKIVSVMTAPVKMRGDGEGDLRGDGDEGGAQRVLADRLLLGEPLGAGGAHVVGN